METIMLIVLALVGLVAYSVFIVNLTICIHVQRQVRAVEKEIAALDRMLGDA